MPTSAVVLDGVPLRIDPAEVRRFQGYQGAAAGAPTAWESRLGEAIEAVSAVMRPRLAHRTLAVRRRGPDGLALADGTILHIPGIDGHWGEVATVTAGLVTIGAAVDGLAGERAGRGDAVGATLLDSTASAAVECLAEWLNDHLCQREVLAGGRVTNRVSPGLAGWDLAEQGRLVAWLPAAAIGVEAPAATILRPAKSISLLVGAGPAVRVDHYFDQCRRCWAAACPVRRQPAGSVVARLA